MGRTSNEVLFSSLTSFPTVGTKNQIYIDTSTQKEYLWNGVAYVEVGGGGIPTQITVANEATDTTCFPLFTTSATGDLGPKTNSGYTFNSNTGLLSSKSYTATGTGSPASLSNVKINSYDTVA